MTTLADVRSYLRTHIDLDASELPDELTDEFIRDATQYIETYRPWNFLASTWTEDTADGTFEYPFSAFTNGSGYGLSRIHAIFCTTASYRTQLRYAGFGLAIGDRSEGAPSKWSQWGESLMLVPVPDGVYSLYIMGWRKPHDWVGDGTGTNVFHLDADFDTPLKTWALGRAYAHQEEGQTAGAYYDLAEFQLMNLAKRYAAIHPFRGLRMNVGYLDSTDEDW